jgi:uncharacterized membrane protein
MLEQHQKTLKPGFWFQPVLRPYRSASTKTLNIIICVMATTWVSVALGFSAAGAWPVTGFLGLDVIALYIALHWNNRTGFACETINLSDNKLIVEKVDLKGQRQSWSFQPYWVRLELAEDVQGRSILTLQSHDKLITIGTFLTNDAREGRARSLKHELALLMKSGPTSVGG